MSKPGCLQAVGHGIGDTASFTRNQCDGKVPGAAGKGRMDARRDRLAKLVDHRRQMEPEAPMPFFDAWLPQEPAGGANPV